MSTDWGWELPPWVVLPCPECGAPGDTPCAKDCKEMNFRDAEFAEIDGQWPTSEERYGSQDQ
jgi:hypothetical protein